MSSRHCNRRATACKLSDLAPHAERLSNLLSDSARSCRITRDWAARTTTRARFVVEQRTAPFQLLTRTFCPSRRQIREAVAFTASPLRSLADGSTGANGVCIAFADSRSLLSAPPMAGGAARLNVECVHGLGEVLVGQVRG
jgi:hypothetical protein